MIRAKLGKANLHAIPALKNILRRTHIFTLPSGKRWGSWWTLRNSTLSPSHDSKLNIRKRIVTLAGIAGIVAAAYFYLDKSRDNVPIAVKELTKAALWQESNKESFNLRQALIFYSKAIEVYDEILGSEAPTCIDDSYTRLELKIAEMYEKLNMPEESKACYMHILDKFYDALLATDRVPIEDRAELIKKDLRVLIKSLEINKDLESGKKNLLKHLMLAQEEVLVRSPDLKKFFEERQNRLQQLMKNRKLFDAAQFKTYIDEDNIKFDHEGYMILNLEKDSSAWEPFKEELFTARDLYTAYCLSSKDTLSALSCKMTSVEWMVMADMPPGQIFLSEANLGSLFYLQAEKFEQEIDSLNKKRKMLSDNQEAEDKNHDDAESLIKALRHLNTNKDTCLKMADKCYQSILKFAQKNNKLRFHYQDQLDPSVVQGIALATYGMGVLHLHKGGYMKAEKLFKDAINIAKDIDFKELINEAEKELEKVLLIKSDNLESTVSS